MLKEDLPSPGYRRHGAYGSRDLKPKLDWINEIMQYFLGLGLLAVPRVKIVGYIGAIKK